MPFKSINPVNGECWAEHREMTTPEVEAKVSKAFEAFREWRHVDTGARAQALREIASRLVDEKESLALLMTREMGKPIREAELEIDKCVWNCEYYAEHGPRFLTNDRIESSAQDSYVMFQPLGVILGIMPWNFPMLQVFRYVAPNLMAGNGVLLKHAPNVTQCAVAIEELIGRCDLPDGIMQALVIQADQVAEIVADNRITGVTFTGSDQTGSIVASIAGQAIKPSVMELGGSDPFIVLEDADLAGAMSAAVASRFWNCGQSCAAAKRILVHESIFQAFIDGFLEKVQNLRVGNPEDAITDVGPMARSDLRRNIARQVEESLAMGAQVLVGGSVVGGPGFYYEPTVLVDVSTQMPVFTEETFGPVAVMSPVTDADEAVAVANNTKYGLGANVWTKDVELGQTVARQLESGSVYINGMMTSDPRLPTGGIKRSGYGREEAIYGIREFVNTKTIWVGPERRDRKSPHRRSGEV